MEHDPHSLAIVVPFRQQLQVDREAQLAEFLGYMTDALPELVPQFRIVVVEQAQDGLRFNRGAMKNAGFLLCANTHDHFIFHDVDLLPDTELLSYYATYPEHPIHLGRVWKKYNYPYFFGGIVAMSRAAFVLANGYPNDFWGWGGEDDDLFERTQITKQSIQLPTRGSVRELVHARVHSEDGLPRLRWERRDQCSRTWSDNGLNSLRFTVQSKRFVGEFADRVVIAVTNPTPSEAERLDGSTPAR
jgi:N-terminal domain of galactosyltransferase/N-terminal region of glycosyl transferase group 7